MKVHLNTLHMRVAELITKTRRNTNRKAGIVDQAEIEASWDVDMQGSLGEMAFAVGMNLCPDMQVVPSPWDFKYKGYTVDVKTVRGPKHHLEVKGYKKPGDCDIFVLVWQVQKQRGDLADTYHILGWISNIDFFEFCHEQKYDNGKIVKRVSQNYIRKMESLS
jgi:hypothetical protein